MTPAERIASLEAEVVRLRAEAAPVHPSPPLHVILDRPSDYPEHPVARLAMERDDLRRRLMEAAPRWQDGEPAPDAWVWREGCDRPVPTLYSEGSRQQPHGIYWLPPENRETGRYEPWGSARWMPIAEPT